MTKSIGSYSPLCALVALALCFGCAASGPSVVRLSAHQSTSGASLDTAVRALAGLGYQIHSTDHSAGVLTASRPIQGMAAQFALPGPGHRINILVDEGSYVVKVFPVDGVWGADSAEAIAQEVLEALGGGDSGLSKSLRGKK